MHTPKHLQSEVNTALDEDEERANESARHPWLSHPRSFIAFALWTVFATVVYAFLTPGQNVVAPPAQSMWQGGFLVLPVALLAFAISARSLTDTMSFAVLLATMVLVAKLER